MHNSTTTNCTLAQKLHDANLDGIENAHERKVDDNARVEGARAQTTTCQTI